MPGTAPVDDPEAGAAPSGEGSGEASGGALRATRADAVTGAGLVLLGLLVAFEGWRMPSYVRFGNSAWSDPGVVPIMVGLVLAVLGAILGWRAYSALRAAPVGGGVGGGTATDPGAWMRVALALALCLLFAGVLVGRVPFWAAAWAFLFAFVVVFDRMDGRVAARSPDARTTAIRLALAAVIASVGALAVTTIFQDVFLVRLP